MTPMTALSPRSLLFGALTLAVTMASSFACGGDDSSGPGGGGTDDAAAPVGPFCPNEPPHKLCSDFDTGTVDQGFTSTDFRNGALVALAPDFALSQPNVAAATAKGGADALGYLVKSFPGPAGNVRVQLEFRAEQEGDDGSGATILAVQASPNHIFTFNMGKIAGGDVVGCGIAEFGVSQTPIANVNCKFGWGLHQWVHLDVMLTYTPPGGHVTVRLNGSDDLLIDAPIAPPDVTGDYTVSIGVRPYTGTGDHRVLFDNVAID